MINMKHDGNTDCMVDHLLPKLAIVLNRPGVELEYLLIICLLISFLLSISFLSIISAFIFVKNFYRPCNHNPHLVVILKILPIFLVDCLSQLGQLVVLKKDKVKKFCFHLLGQLVVLKRSTINGSLILMTDMQKT